MGVVAELHAQTSKGGERSIALYKLPDTMVVGRGSMCDWQIEDNSLSRRHATLHWDGSRLEVEDMKSANGTRVGGQAVSGRVAVPFGGTIHLGTVAITLARPQASLGESLGADGESTHTAPMPGPPAVVDVRAMPTQTLDRSSVMRPSAVRMVAPQPPPPPPSFNDQATPASVPSASARSFAPPSAPGLSTRLSDHAAETRVAPAPGPLPPERPRLPAPPPPNFAPESTRPRTAVFRPAQHRAGPADITGQWDPAVVTQKVSERLIDTTKLVENIKERWRTNRRPFVLAGAALWVGIVLIAVVIHESRHPDEDDELADAPAAHARPAKPKVTPSEPTSAASPGDDDSTPPAAIADPNSGKPTVTPMVTSLGGPPPREKGRMRGAVAAAVPAPPTVDPNAPVDKEALLLEAVANYDQGRVDDALASFRRLADADPTNAAAKYMVELLGQKK